MVKDGKGRRLTKQFVTKVVQRLFKACGVQRSFKAAAFKQKIKDKRKKIKKCVELRFISSEMNTNEGDSALCVQLILNAYC